jgi:hypothetical protein
LKNPHSRRAAILMIAAMPFLPWGCGQTGTWPGLRQSPQAIPSPAGNIVYRPIYGLPRARTIVPSVYGSPGAAEAEAVTAPPRRAWRFLAPVPPPEPVPTPVLLP